MHSQKKIDSFIKLRAENVTYDDLTIKLKVSKPTLINWGKKYEEEIKMSKLNNVLEMYTNNLIFDESRIIIYAEWMRRIRRSEDKKINNDANTKKVMKKIEEIFGKQISGMKLHFHKTTEQLNSMEIHFLTPDEMEKNFLWEIDE